MIRKVKVMTMAGAALGLSVWNSVAHAREGADGSELPMLVPLEPLAVPIVDHGEMLGRLQVRAMWRSLDAESQKVAEERLPQLRAALVQGVADHARLDAAPSQPVDPVAIARRLQQSAAANGFKGELLVLEATSRSG